MQSNSTQRASRQPSVIQKCLQCQAEFRASVSDIRSGRGKFCGRPCFATYRLRRVEVVCPNCGRDFTETPARISDGRGRYCSKRCANEAKVGVTDPLAYFWQHVAVQAGCWGWTGRADQFGYGVICFRRAIILVHRLSWDIHNGPVPDRLCVLHCCDNPPCSNPAHLFLGTKADNNRDRARKGRSAVGSLSGQAKLTEDAVREIRRRYIRGSRTAGGSALATEFNVTPGIILKAVRRELWTHVE